MANCKKELWNFEQKVTTLNKKFWFIYAEIIVYTNFLINIFSSFRVVDNYVTKKSGKKSISQILSNLARQFRKSDFENNAFKVFGIEK